MTAPMKLRLQPRWDCGNSPDGTAITTPMRLRYSPDGTAIHRPKSKWLKWLGWVVVVLEISDVIELGRGKLAAFGDNPVRNASHIAHIALTACSSGWS
jgi:hypothetical protein